MNGIHLNISRILLGLLVCSVASPGMAQESQDDDRVPNELIPIPDDVDVTGKGMPEIDVNCRDAEAFGGTKVEKGAWCLLAKKKYIGARTLASSAVLQDSDSFRAHYLLGTALHLGDGNLPKALYHLNKSEKLFIDEHGVRPLLTGKAPILVYHRTLVELIYVHGEMDHHEKKIEYVDELKYRLSDDLSPLKAWPLLKMKRFEEAQKVAETAVNEFGKENPYWRAVGLTALCAVHSENRERKKAYEACMDAAAPVRASGVGGGVALSNAAGASIEAFKFEQAERLYMEATRRDVEGTINPWGRLTYLYLRQGRFAEAVSALREMQGYRTKRPAYFDQQDQTDAELTGAVLLFVAGYTKEAERITGRVVDRPDRQGTSSASSEQNEAGTLLLDVVVKRELARKYEEEASWSSWRNALKLHYEAKKIRFQAWLNMRRASTLLSDPDLLATSLRPECPGSIEISSWLNGEVVRAVGAGVALATIEQEKETETLEEQFSEPVFSGYAAEAYLLKHDYDAAVLAGEKALAGFPDSDVLPRARVAVVTAMAARELGDRQRAIELLETVLLRDPGAIRRLGYTLPVRMTVTDFAANEAQEILDVLSDSPLFEQREWGLLLDVSPSKVSLSLPNGTQILTARIPPTKNTDLPFRIRQIAKVAHQDLLIPRVDITQSDIRSLDGGVLGGERTSEKVESILDSIVNPQ